MFALRTAVCSVVFASGLMGCASQGLTSPQYAPESTYLTQGGRELAVQPPSSVTGAVGTPEQSPPARNGIACNEGGVGASARLCP